MRILEKVRANQEPYTVIDQYAVLPEIGLSHRMVQSLPGHITYEGNWEKINKEFKLHNLPYWMQRRHK